MNILLLVGADGWLGSSIKKEISKSFLKSLEIDVLLFHSKTSNNCFYEEISQDNILTRNIYGDFRRKKAFQELNEILKNLNTNKLYVICALVGVVFFLWGLYYFGIKSLILDGNKVYVEKKLFNRFVIRRKDLGEVSNYETIQLVN